MRYRILETASIDASDGSFAFRLPGLPPAIAESVARYGVLCPLALRERPGAFQVVSGRRRLAAAAHAGLKSIPCLVFGQDELAPLEALRLIMEENRFGPGFTAFEAGKILSLFAAHGLTADEIESGIAPRLGIPPGRESVARHMAVASMDPGIVGHPISRDGSLLSLARLPKDAAKTLWEAWIVPKRPSVQEVRQAVELIEDLSTGSCRAPAQTLADALARSAGLPLLGTLRSERYPGAAAIEEGFARSCETLPKGVRARMTTTDAVEFTVSARDAARLSAAARLLSENLPALEAVFRAAAGE